MILMFKKFPALILALCIISCKTAKKSTLRNFEASGFVRAEIKKFEVDGCGFMLFLNEKEKLNPDVLPVPFQKEGQKVWVKYEVKKPVMSTCMAGKNIHILEIEIRSEE